MADSFLEIWQGGERASHPLEQGRVSIGRSTQNDVALADERASRLHAVLEKIGPGWCVRDLDSSNGTYVNGQRVSSDRVLKHGDEITIGDTRLRFLDFGVRSEAATSLAGDTKPPEVTRREKEVLVELCLPLAGDDPFPEPATTAQIAEALVVTEAAVRQHLLRLYDKFAIYEDEGSRRGRLAREALKRGVVTRADIGGGR